MYIIKNNIEDKEIGSFATDSELTNFVRKIAVENDDEELSITVIGEALDYLKNYCDNLDLTTVTDEVTNVLFLLEKPEGDLPCDVFAYFPDENYYSEGNIGYGGVTKENWQEMKVSYAHIGQHSSCHINYILQCKKATKEQYNDLYNELIGIGYILNVLNN